VLFINRQRTKLNEPHAQPDLEIAVPDSDQCALVLLPSAWPNLSPNAIAACREEMAALVFEQLDFCVSQERRIVERLQGTKCSEDDRKHLANALETIRSCIRIAHDLVARWGLVRPEASQNRVTESP
jgi:hypothetical protein